MMMQCGKKLKKLIKRCTMDEKQLDYFDLRRSSFLCVPKLDVLLRQANWVEENTVYYPVRLLLP